MEDEEEESGSAFIDWLRRIYFGTRINDMPEPEDAHGFEAFQPQLASHDAWHQACTRNGKAQAEDRFHQ